MTDRQIAGAHSIVAGLTDADMLTPAIYGYNGVASRPSLSASRMDMVRRFMLRNRSELYVVRKDMEKMLWRRAL